MSIDELLAEMDFWRREGAYCTPAEFAKILIRPGTELTLANPQLLTELGKRLLEEVVQTLYHVSLVTDEGRALAFNLVFRSAEAEARNAFEGRLEEAFDNAFKYWPFQHPRPFALQELRRLAVCNPDTSGIWIELADDEPARLEIKGLAQLGQKWMDSVESLSYEYANRKTPLIFRVEGPGWIEVYNGSRFFARLKAGVPQVALPEDIRDKNVLHRLVQDGFTQLALPAVAGMPDAEYFLEYSYYSVILAIVNSIQRLAHGGAVILTPSAQKPAARELLNIKYALHDQEQILQQAYLDFIETMREGFALRARGPQKRDRRRHHHSPQDWEKKKAFFYRVNQIHRNLTECCRLVGGFSSADGAIVLDTSLTVMGFSAEILLEQIDAASTQKVIHKLAGHLLADRQLETEVLDLAHMGMRHRSAAKLCTVLEDAAVFVVSQDGGVSLIWNRAGEVYFWEDFRTKNMPFDLIPPDQRGSSRLFDGARREPAAGSA